MNRFNSTCAVALMCAGFCAGAVAQEKSTAAQTTDKAQARTSKSSSSAKGKMQHSAQTGKMEVRDWKAIDKNHDNLIEPSEMEAYLNHAHSTKSSSAKTKS